MNQNSSAWQPPTTKEITVTLALFAIPAIAFAVTPAIARTTGGRLPEWLGYLLLAIIPVALVLGIIKGFPRWTVPYVGIVVTVIVMLELSYPLWGFFATDVRRIFKYSKTLQARVLYSALMSGFIWFMVFIAAVILILLLMAWPRTRQLARRIRADWTLLSFLLYGGVVFTIVLVFENYRYDEPWMIACWTCLAAGAWVYLKSSDPRKRSLALLTGVTLAYWIAAIGKWYLVPLQTWGAFHGYQYEIYRWFEFWRTLAEWGWVMLFMTIPALLTLIPRPQESDLAPEENLAPA